jgi:hypothetical protein
VGVAVGASVAAVLLTGTVAVLLHWRYRKYRSAADPDDKMAGSGQTIAGKSTSLQSQHLVTSMVLPAAGQRGPQHAIPQHGTPYLAGPTSALPGANVPSAHLVTNMDLMAPSGQQQAQGPAITQLPAVYASESTRTQQPSASRRQQSWSMRQESTVIYRVGEVTSDGRTSQPHEPPSS